MEAKLADLRSTVATALTADFKRQWDGQALSDRTGWYANGGTIDLMETADAALKAIEDAGYVVAPKKPTEAMETAGYMEDPDLSVNETTPDE